MDLLSVAGFIGAALAVGYYCGYTSFGAEAVTSAWTEIKSFFGK